MKFSKFHKTIKMIRDENQGKYEILGIRFEDKNREIGEVCECSRHNPDRNDERDFPEYGTPEYEELEILDGTSAWSLDDFSAVYRIETWQNPEDDVRDYHVTDHCYIIAGDRGTHNDPDVDEVLIKNAVVIAKIF